MTFSIFLNTISIYYNTASINKAFVMMVGSGTVQIAAINTGITIASNNNLFTTGRAVSYGESTYYAVGEGSNTMAYSTDDGNTWTAVSPSPFSTAGYDILYTGTNWIAAGTGGNTLAYYNNITWTPISTGLTIGTRLFHDSVSSSPRIYALGTGAVGSGANTFTFASSVTGPWRGIKDYVFGNKVNAMHGPAVYSTNRRWVMGTPAYVLDANQIITTTTPDISSSWTGTRQVFPNNCNDVEFGTDSSMNNLWIVAGGFTNSNYDTSVQIGVSNTGTTWTSLTEILGNTRSTPTSYLYTTSVAYGCDASGKSMWLVGGLAGNYIAYSYTPDISTSWVKLGSINVYQETRVSFGFDTSGNPLWMFGLGAVVRYSFTGQQLFANWSAVSVTFCAVINMLKCGTDGSGNTLWVGVGGPTGGSAVGYSINGGRTWTTSTPAIGVAISDVEYGTDGSGNPLWVCVGGTTFGYSYDGKTWTTYTQSFFSESNGITYGIDNSGSPIWYATGGQTNVIAYSKSGTGNWTSITNFAGVLRRNFMKQSREPIYISGGTGAVNMKGSFDGQTWYYIQSPFSVSTNDVHWNNTSKLWVAAGEGGNTIAYSENGIKWIGNNSVFSLRGNRIRNISGTGRYYAVGEGGTTLAQSSDGKTWLPMTTTGYVDISGLGLNVVSL